jgi:Domain amino terminal to FKBP-type peptidyl-prolyl isomerase
VCDNTGMRKPSTHLLTTLACGLVAVSGLAAQQAAAPSTTHSSSTAAKTQSTKTQSTTTKTGSAAKTSTAAKTTTLDTDKQKQSYAIGMSFAKSLQRQSVDVDPNLVSQALKDSFAGKALLTDEQAKAALDTLQSDMRAKMEAKMQEAGKKNKQEGDAFLAANKAKEGVVTLPSGLQYKIVKQGTGPKPTAADKRYRIRQLRKTWRPGNISGRTGNQGLDGSAATDAGWIEVATLCARGSGIW